MIVKEIKPGYHLYEDGRVYSDINGKFLKQTLSKDTGYLTYSSYLGSVHRLLARHFKGPIPEGYVVNHIDGNKLNNNLDNLEIVTPSENVRHAFTKGLAEGQKGEANSMAKLTQDDIMMIGCLLQTGWDNESIAQRYGLHPRYVSLIRHGKRWKETLEDFGKFPPSNKKCNDHRKS